MRCRKEATAKYTPREDDSRVEFWPTGAPEYGLHHIGTRATAALARVHGDTTFQSWIGQCLFWARTQIWYEIHLAAVGE